MIPALTAKTTALFVDDEDSLLEDLCDLLPKTHFFKTLNNPLMALEHLKPYQQPSFTNQESLLEDFKATRFDDLISVMIVDHCMNPINGIELCQQIKAPAPKRIMLTAQATKDTAIKALNSKLIDAFLFKTEVNIVNLLSTTIQKCTTDFFNELSMSIYGYKNNKNPLTQEVFKVFFYNFCNDKNIKSYCCFHDFYNIVLMDDKEKETYITIYDNEHLDDLLISEQAQSAQSNIIDKILNRQAAPCFRNKETPLMPEGTTWENLMVPLTPLSKDLFVAVG